MRDQPLQNEWLLHQGGRVDLALGVALAPRATGPRRGPNQGCLRHCSLREWCPPGRVVLACGVTDSSPGPNKGQLPGGRVLPPWVSGQLVQHGGRAGGRSTGRSVLMPDLPVPEPFASPPPRERPPGVGGDAQQPADGCPDRAGLRQEGEPRRCGWDGLARPGRGRKAEDRPAQPRGGVCL